MGEIICGWGKQNDLVTFFRTAPIRQRIILFKISEQIGKLNASCELHERLSKTKIDVWLFVFSQCAYLSGCSVVISVGTAMSVGRDLFMLTHICLMLSSILIN